jgi:thiol-disulfide isomerase/thioredoxin
MALAGLAGFSLAALTPLARAALPLGPAIKAFETLPERRPAPDLTFRDGDDKEIALADFRGKTVLVNFWATWCIPCVKEMPSLAKLQESLGAERFRVVALSLDGPQTRAKVAPFIRDKNLGALAVYFDIGRKAMRALDVSVLPTSVLIDPQGREVGRLQGDAEWAAPEAVALMRHVMDGGA